MRERAGSVLLRPRLPLVLLITLICYLGIVGLATRHYRYNLSALVDIGDIPLEPAVRLAAQPIGHRVVIFTHSAGNDGQLYYFVAEDPLPMVQSAHFRDAFRYQRILYPLLAAVISLGQRDARPFAMVFINLLSILACAWLSWLIALELVAPAIRDGPGSGRGTATRSSGGHSDVSWWVLLAAINPSLILAVQMDVPEPLALALSLGGLWAWMRGWPVKAALLFALALLTREIAVLVAGATVAAAVARHQWRAALLLCLAVIPYLAWQTVLAHTFHQVGAARSAANFGPPFGGMIAVARATAADLTHHRIGSLLVHEAPILMTIVILLGIGPLSVWQFRLDDHIAIAATLVLTWVAGILATGLIWATNYASAGRVFAIMFPLLFFSLVTRRRGRPLTLGLCVLALALTTLTIVRVIAVSPVVPYTVTP